MKTIKSYSDLSQSKKLAEILPLESADMAWCNNSIKGINYTDKYHVNPYTIKEMKDIFDEVLVGWDKNWKLIPCWSLDALFNYLRKIDFFPNIKADEHSVIMNISYYDEKEARPLAPVHSIKVKADTFVDACYEMIIKLKGQNLL